MNDHVIVLKPKPTGACVGKITGKVVVKALDFDVTGDDGITQHVHYPECEFRVIQVVMSSTGNLIYVTDQMYKPNVPQLVPDTLVKEFIPDVSVKEIDVP